MTSPPDPDSRRRSEEPIAVLVAFLALGSVFFWATSQKQPAFDLLSLGKPTGTASPTVAPTVGANPSPTVTIAPGAGLTTTPSPSPSISTTVDPSASGRAGVVPVVVPDASSGSGTTSSDSATLTTPQPTVSKFSDVPTDFWATPFINALAERGIIRGFENDTYQPNKPVTRAEFATMLQKAFENQPKVRQSLNFRDLPPNYWARSSINETFQTGFLNGYPDAAFLPNQEIPKVQALTALANGLKLTNADTSAEVLKAYQDSAQIPAYAVDKVAAATEAGLVVNYPDRTKLNPSQVTTRADAAALIYQALVSAGKAEAIPSDYAVPR